MDGDAQTNQQPERVEISDYRGTSAAPMPTAAPPRQPSIKQDDGERAIVPSALPVGLTLHDGKLVVVKSKWHSMQIRYAGVIFVLVLTAQAYDGLVKAVWTPHGTPSFAEITDAIFTRPNFELVFYSLVVLAGIALSAFYVQQAVKFIFGRGEILTFDRAAGTLANSESRQSAPTMLRDIAAVNLDHNGDKWRVALATTAGKVVELDSWKDEQTARQAAEAIASYLGVGIERTEAAAGASTGLLILLASAIGIYAIAGVLYWLWGLLFH